MMYEVIDYNGWNGCARLYNDEIELVVATEVGPRIVRFGFIGKQNFFYLLPGQAGKTGGGEWRIYGGHRLWHAPEAMPRSYCPDNLPVRVTRTDNGIKLVQRKEELTGIVKEMEITLLPGKNVARIIHRLTNHNLWGIELSAWALSVLAAGGTAILPQEPHDEGNDFLLPCRSVALWQYTKMGDPRWVWGSKYILAKQDPAYEAEQKIGITNKQGWSAYSLSGELLIKKFDFIEGRKYPDFESNNEIYINGSFLEMETVGPLTRLAPGQSVEHVEHWSLVKMSNDLSEDLIDQNILPIVNAFNV